MLFKHQIISFGVVMLLSGCAADASFHSSDGVWEDSTCEFKGRDFKSILYCFEQYKIQSKNHSCELHRSTPTPSAWDIFWSIGDRSNPKWNVPYCEGLECQSKEQWNKTPPVLSDEENVIAKKAVQEDLKYFSKKIKINNTENNQDNHTLTTHEPTNNGTFDAKTEK